MQPFDEIEASYKTPDPWGFRSNPADRDRKGRIVDACLAAAQNSGIQCFRRALEIGAGEGFIAECLPALEVHGLEVSKTARSRMPANVTPRDRISLEERFDLVVIPGVLYGHYHVEDFFEIVRRNASRIVVTCNIEAWEDKRMEDPEFLLLSLGLIERRKETFSYREYIQRLRVLEKALK